MTTPHHHTSEIVSRRGARRPPAQPTWFGQAWLTWACGVATGHCWHIMVGSPLDWWCCMCSGETDGFPASRCIHCDRKEKAT